MPADLNNYELPPLNVDDFGFDDIDIGNIDEILECGDDLIDIE